MAARWPAGLDVVPASALDRHEFSTRRAVAIVPDAPIDWEFLATRYPPDVVEAARARGPGAIVELPPQDPYADLGTVGAIARIAERLRAPEGCPWDREQTHASLRPHLLEEAHEALEAIDRLGEAAAGEDRHGALAAELGDLLFQVVLHAQLAREEGRFDLADVARHIGTKLVRRHPHVFAGTSLRSDELLLQWERIKSREREGKGSLLDGVPLSLPALFAAERMQERAARVGLEPERVDLPLDVDDPETLGELLFELVALAREHGWDAETELREANERFRERVARIEARGRPLESYSADELRALWEAS